MGPVTGLMVFVVIWWIVFFMLLPVGNRTAAEAGETVVPGTVESAPVKPRLWLKAAATTAIACLLWGLYYFVAENDLLGFREYLTSR